MIFYIFIFLYLCIFFYRNTIETSITFTGMWDQKEYILPKNFEEINIKDDIWDTINWVFLDNKKPKTIFYFHGNGWSISDYFSTIVYLWDLGYNVMAYDYPGYGKSGWYPLESKVYNYSKAFFEYVAKEKWIKVEDTIVFGHSIGTGVWADFAFRNNVEKMILLSPLSSRYEMSIAKYGVILQHILFMKNSFDTLAKIEQIHIPTLIIHGNQDTVIPYEQWKSVFENSASKNKFFITLNNSGHNGIIKKYGEVLNPILKEFLETWNLDKKLIEID